MYNYAQRSVKTSYGSILEQLHERHKLRLGEAPGTASMDNDTMLEISYASFPIVYFY